MSTQSEVGRPPIPEEADVVAAWHAYRANEGIAPWGRLAGALSRLALAVGDPNHPNGEKEQDGG